jgi:hypothetical protein
MVLYIVTFTFLDNKWEDNLNLDSHENCFLGRDRRTSKRVFFASTEFLSYYLDKLRLQRVKGTKFRIY